MEKRANVNCPLVGMATRRGVRNEENSDRHAYFEVQRRDVTTRLLSRADSSDEETAPLHQKAPGQPVAAVQPADIYVAVVADGVTNTSGGAQASRLAVDAVRATLQEPPSRHETISEWLEFAIVRANEEIIFEGRRTPEWQGMSTTIVLAALAGDKLYVMHLGDSRAYLIRDGMLHQLTADHTWTQEALNSGAITEAEASKHPGRNHLLRYLGTQRPMNVDRGVMMPDTAQREEYLYTRPGDSILLCTDGLHHMLKPAEIVQLVQLHRSDPQGAVDALVKRVVSKGERDDITALLMEIPGQTPVASAGDHPPSTATTSARAPLTHGLSRLQIALAILVVLALFLLVWMVW